MPALEDATNLPLSDILPVMQRRIVEDTFYFGVRTLKSPLDFWVYQELLFALQPDVIVEIGNRFGGSTLALAHLCDLMGRGRVVGVDIDQSEVAPLVRAHPRIRLLEGDACALAPDVAGLIGEHETVVVIEDSSHTFDNTLGVLRAYGGLVKPGFYFIVEDSICHHGLDVGPNPGPYEAIEAFVKEHPEFIIDRSKESFLITWNPKGYLLRTK